MEGDLSNERREHELRKMKNREDYKEDDVEEDR